MKRFIMRLSVWLFAVLLVSCGGGGGDSPSGGDNPGTSGGGTAPATDTGTPPPPPATDTGTPPPPPATDTGTPPPPPATDTGTPPPPPPPATDTGTPPPTTGGGTLPSAGALVESDTAAVSLTGAWEPSDRLYGWSGGGARQSAVAGAKASFKFIGTSVTWIGGRSRDAGIALVSVDGGAPKRVDLFSRAREARTPVLTIHDLSAGEHTLTIEVTGLQNENARSNVVIVDAFEVEAPIVSRLQDSDTDPHPDRNVLTFSAGWVDDARFRWSGCCTEESVPGAKVTETAGETVRFKFRGTTVRWLGYRGPEAGIARVQVDDREPEVVDLYSAKRKIQEVVFTASGLADTAHTLTITAMGLKSDASTGAQVVVDAFEVITPGKRYQESYQAPAGPVGVPPDPNRVSIIYTGQWDFFNVNRPWSEGMAYTTSTAGSRVDFTFTGTSVSWIGCEKATIGRAKIYIDGAEVVNPLNMRRDVPIEAYQKTVYRIDGLAPGQHTLSIEALTTGPFVVVDAFDVRP